MPRTEEYMLETLPDGTQHIDPDLSGFTCESYSGRHICNDPAEWYRPRGFPARDRYGDSYHAYYVCTPHYIEAGGVLPAEGTATKKRRAGRVLGELTAVFKQTPPNRVVRRYSKTGIEFKGGTENTDVSLSISKAGKVTVLVKRDGKAVLDWNIERAETTGATPKETKPRDEFFEVAYRDFGFGYERFMDCLVDYNVDEWDNGVARSMHLTGMTDHLRQFFFHCERDTQHRGVRLWAAVPDTQSDGRVIETRVSIRALNEWRASREVAQLRAEAQVSPADWEQRVYDRLDRVVPQRVTPQAEVPRSPRYMTLDEVTDEVQSGGVEWVDLEDVHA